MWDSAAATGEPKVVAAAQVALLEAQLAQMGEEPLFDSARKVLQKQLEQTRKHAVDKRTDAKKLLDKETWVARESKRLDAERKSAAEQMELIEKRQQLLEKEIEDVAKLRSNLSVETEPKE